MSRFTPLLAVFGLVIPHGLDAQTMRSDAGVTSSLLGFGTAVAVADGRVFVGRTEDFPSFALPPDGAGSVHVFEKSGGEWMETAKLTVDGLSSASSLGYALAADGNTVLVGAPHAMDARGAAFVFEHTGNEWQLAARLEPPSAAAGDSTGFAVALSGDVALVGAPGGRGAVYVFRKRGGQWMEAETMTAPQAVDGQRFGAAVALGDGVAAVSAPGPAPASILAQFTGVPTYQPGRVHVYRMGSQAYALEASLAAADSTVRSLGISLVFMEVDNLLVAGAPVSGHMVPFAYVRDRWVEPEGATLPSKRGGFGMSLAVSGLDLLVGAPGSQTVYVFRQDGMGNAAQEIKPEATFNMMPTFGAAVAADGDVAVVGAPGEDFFEGVGYVLTRDVGTWTHTSPIVDDPTAVAAVTDGELKCEDGSVAGFDCSRVDLVSYLPSRELGAGRGVWISDLWGWTDPLTNREIAIVGRIDGTAFVDLSNPTSPVYLGELPLTEGARPNLWRDMKVYRDHAFIVADNAGRHGMQVFDLTRLRDLIAPVTFTPDTTYFGIYSSHNIAINEETGFAFTVGNSAGGQTCGGQAHMVDIRDPRNPTFAGCAGPSSTHTHDLQCVNYDGPDTDYRGREVCFHSAAELLGITDVTNKDSTSLIATAGYPSLAYAHQGWLSDDRRYFYLNDELDEVSGQVDRTRTMIFDVADLDDPVLVNQYFGESNATDHNLYVHGQYMYESNYVAGLRVLDISDPENPVEVGYFDTVSGSPDAPGFAGSWSNYPYFASGIVVATSIREGLFVLRPEPRALVP